MGRKFYRYIDHQIKNDLKLIISVKCHPIIYNVSDPSYNNRSERKRIWEMIAKHLRSTAKVCEGRWNKLVQMYKSLDMQETLLEIMDQFLNGNFESTDNTAFLSPEDSEERIDLEEMINESACCLPVRPHTLNIGKYPVCHKFVDSFFDEGDVYYDMPHSP